MNDEILQDLMDGRLAAGQEIPLWEHMAVCAICRVAYEEGLALQRLFVRENEKIAALGTTPSSALDQAVLGTAHRSLRREIGGLILAAGLAVMAWVTGGPIPGGPLLSTATNTLSTADPAVWVALAKEHARQEHRSQSAARRTEAILNNLF
jgi:anti-sigma factor RsiW